MIKRKGRKPRRGLIVVAVLVCLVVMMLLGAALLKVALMERESNREAERRLQAQWLVESGLERARAKLAADASYAGETWTLGAAELGLADSAPASSDAGNEVRAGGGVVTISVDRSVARGRCLVRVQADYPRGGPHPSRHSQQQLTDLEAHTTGAKP
jgi:Tfp pilus assembly protein PilV